MLSRAPLFLFLLSFAGLIAIVFQGVSVSVRFESDLLNYAFVLGVMLLLPASIVWGAYRIFSGQARRNALIVLCGVFTLILFFPLRHVTNRMAEIVKTGHDGSLVQLDEQVINGHQYRLYRIGVGGDTDLLLRGESSLTPGLKTVRTIKYVYSADNAKLESLPSGMARLAIESTVAGKPVENFEFQP